MKPGWKQNLVLIVLGGIGAGLLYQAFETGWRKGGWVLVVVLGSTALGVTAGLLLIHRLNR